MSTRPAPPGTPAAHRPRPGARARYRTALADLAAAQKPARNVQAYSRWVNRPAGRRLAAAAHVLGLRPDQVTALSAVVTLGSVVALAVAPPGPATGAAVWAGLALGYALDAADGQLARLTGGGTPFGEWLDHLLDAVKTATLHLAVAVHLYLAVPAAQHPAPVLLVPLAWSAASCVMFFGQMLIDQLRRAGRGRGAPGPHPVGPPAPPRPRDGASPYSFAPAAPAAPPVPGAPGAAGASAVPVAPAAPAAPGRATGPDRAGAVRSWLVAPSDYGLVVTVLLLLDGPAFVPVYTAWLGLYLAYLAVAVRQWGRELRGTPPTAARPGARA